MGDFFLDLINWLVEGIGATLSGILELFPDSPFSNPAPTPVSMNLQYVAWLIPFNQMLVHLVGLASAILAYYLIRVLARWVKLVRN